jgi:hypothetical protein
MGVKMRRSSAASRCYSQLEQAHQSSPATSESYGSIEMVEPGFPYEPLLFAAERFRRSSEPSARRIVCLEPRNAGADPAGREWRGNQHEVIERSRKPLRWPLETPLLSMESAVIGLKTRPLLPVLLPRRRAKGGEAYRTSDLCSLYRLFPQRIRTCRPHAASRRSRAPASPRNLPWSPAGY